MKILAFTGMPFSGKSVAVQIAKDMNFPVIRMGDAIWEEVKHRGLSLTDCNVGTVANEMRKQHGKDIWAQRTLEKIKSMDKTKTLIIDGIRNIEEIDTFKKELDKNFVVIAIESSDETRYKRALQRGREDDSGDIELVKQRDQRELNWGLDVVIASADAVVSNEGSESEFKNEIRKILAEL
jgi:dephospho-CoA kinase